MKRASILALATLAFACRAHETTHDSSRLETVGGGRAAVIRTEGASISLFVREGTLAISDAELMAWVRRGAHAVAVYYGRFPVAHVAIDLTPVDGNEIGEGQATPQEQTPTIRMTLGSRTRDLDDDWVLVHEMVHLATPSLPKTHLWFEEGVASYVEPIARVQSGRKSADDVVREWVSGMPQGEPERGDQGLDRTHTWGRTYWGGALFCLLADVRIRERTSNRFGLQDALRAVLEKLGGGRVDSSMEEVIAVGDAAVGVPVLRELYEQEALSSSAVDLHGLWQQLGIKGRGHRLTLDDSAPLASVRLAIFMPHLGR